MIDEEPHSLFFPPVVARSYRAQYGKNPPLVGDGDLARQLNELWKLRHVAAEDSWPEIDDKMFKLAVTAVERRMA